MGHYLKGPAEVLTRLFPRHDFQRDARILGGGEILIEVTATEIPTSSVESETEVQLLSHAEALDEVNALRTPAPPEPEDLEG